MNLSDSVVKMAHTQMLQMEQVNSYYSLNYLSYNLMLLLSIANIPHEIDVSAAN